MGATAVGGALIHSVCAPGAWGQRVVPKLREICPMGYVDTAKGTCSTLGLMTHTVQPSKGEACPSGWANAGGGYCRKSDGS
ncbi:hypothetical protein [Synechococcus sp. UW105]|jgi:hypothetical protein|uniref:hypothetical protein n=1 Tax=Synechococcus sp. UW105 TaxID=337067 RepID=UPI000C8DC5DC|nr:hypothetical protein [Synechococcus sp. UW105]MAS28708.1 hypothetical protein [Synechococcus sp. NAT40]RZO14328.1 MAG: hypothetical protein EVB08_03280 [Synechococcus sp. MED-G135]